MHKAKPIEINGAKISYEVSGKEHGLIKVQESTELIIHSKIEHRISGQVNVDDGFEETSSPIEKEGVTTFEMTERKK